MYTPDASLDIKSYLAGAAPALEFNGNLAPFCELLEKIGRLVRAGDAFFVHPDDDIPAAQPHFPKHAVGRNITDPESGRFIVLHIRR